MQKKRSTTCFHRILAAAIPVILAGCTVPPESNHEPKPLEALQVEGTGNLAWVSGHVAWGDVARIQLERKWFHNGDESTGTADRTLILNKTGIWHVVAGGYGTTAYGDPSGHRVSASAAGQRIEHDVEIAQPRDGSPSILRHTAAFNTSELASLHELARDRPIPFLVVYFSASEDDRWIIRGEVTNATITGFGVDVEPSYVLRASDLDGAHAHAGALIAVDAGASVGSELERPVVWAARWGITGHGGFDVNTPSGSVWDMRRELGAVALEHAPGNWTVRVYEAVSGTHFDQPLLWAVSVARIDA